MYGIAQWSSSSESGSKSSLVDTIEDDKPTDPNQASFIFVANNFLVRCHLLISLWQTNYITQVQCSSDELKSQTYINALA